MEKMNTPQQRAAEAAPSITVSRLPTPLVSGDWHDKPLVWTVQGPSGEVQHFRTKAWALAYARARRKSGSFAEAQRRFAELAL